MLSLFFRNMMFLVSFLFLILLPLSIYCEPLKVNISAKSAILINGDTGAVLFAKEPQMPCHPASITKIATALYVLDQRSDSLGAVVTASQEAVGVISPQAKRAGGDKVPPYRLTSDGTHMSLQVGETLSMHDLLHGLMIVSGNDAANVIAEQVSSSVPQFMEALNHYLREMGCTHTHFVNPHGLPHKQQITTAEDMAKVTAKALQFPLFREIVSQREFLRPQTNKQSPVRLVQFNKLLKRGPYYYPKAIGVKTGYTDAGANLVAAAKEGERTLIAVILYCSDLNQRFKDAITLFEAAFREEKTARTLLTKDHERFTRVIKGGRTPLEAALIEDVQIEFFPAEEPKLKALLKWDVVSLPIHEGHKVGEVHLVDERGILFKMAPLFAKKDVSLTFLAQVGNIYELAKAKKALIVALFGLALIALGLIWMMTRTKSKQKIDQ